MCYCFVFGQFKDVSANIQGDSEVRKHTMINVFIFYSNGTKYILRQIQMSYILLI